MTKTIRRRTVIKSAVAAMTTLALPEFISARDRKPTIKVLGTHVTLQEPIRLRAERELGINIEFYPGGSSEVLLKASTEPDSFDLYEQWSDSIKLLWAAGTIKSIDTKRLTYWNEINSLSKTGKISADAVSGAGDVPNKLLFVQPNGSIGPSQSDQISFLPYVHNVDSFGYNSNVIAKGIPYETESWAWLLNPTHHGRVALVNTPTIGIFDLALAAQSVGLITFNDIGNMTIEEIDELFKIANRFKLAGHFRSFWSSVPHSVDLMASGEVDIQSMFSPGVSMVRGQGVPCIYAAPREGYRAWQGVMCMSQSCDGERQDAAYRFMNWWLSGWAGAFIARQGYYISNPERSRDLMSETEWDYWYEGKPAATRLEGTDGRISVAEGEMRTGGSYLNRFEHIAVWNTVMDNFDRTLEHWGEFVLA